MEQGVSKVFNPAWFSVLFWRTAFTKAKEDPGEKGVSVVGQKSQLDFSIVAIANHIPIGDAYPVVFRG